MNTSDSSTLIFMKALFDFSKEANEAFRVKADLPAQFPLKRRMTSSGNEEGSKAKNSFVGKVGKLDEKH